MSDENAAAPVEAEAVSSATSANPGPDPAAQLAMAELEALRRKNRELLDEKKKLQAKIPDIPEGVDVEELLEFKRKAEQEEAERQGKYQEALQAYAKQFQEKEAKLATKVQDLESQLTHSRLDSRVLAMLADKVHDPEDALRLMKDKLALDDAGNPIARDGYQELPLEEYLGKLHETKPWLFKAPKPQGSGAPVGRAGGTPIPPGVKNPFERATFNLTEQARLFKSDPELYSKLKAAAR